MDKKKLMLLLGAMIVALVSALAVRSMLSGNTAPVGQATALLVPRGPRVLVAQRALPVGTIITADAVGFQPWPRAMVQDAYFVEGAVDKVKLIGTVVRNPITAGQPLTQGALVAPGDRGFLAAALLPGMRAVTIPVSDMSGVAGFIFPGDHIDIMLTQTVKSSDPQNPNALPFNLTETVLRNLRVLATDQTTETEVTATGKTVAKTAHDVTLEVSPRVAEKIEVAQTLGSLSLALRSLTDDQDEFDQATATGALQGLNVALQGPKGALPGLRGQVANGGATPHQNGPALPLPTAVSGEGATSYSTGGDVSRFARRTLPKVGYAPPRAMRGNVNQGGWNQNGAELASPHPARAMPTGPTIRIARGNSISAEPVGNNGAAGRLGLPGMPGQSGGASMDTAILGGE